MNRFLGFSRKPAPPKETPPPSPSPPVSDLPSDEEPPSDDEPGPSEDEMSLPPSDEGSDGPPPSDPEDEGEDDISPPGSDEPSLDGDSDGPPPSDPEDDDMSGSIPAPEDDDDDEEEESLPPSDFEEDEGSPPPSDEDDEDEGPSPPASDDEPLSDDDGSPEDGDLSVDGLSNPSEGSPGSEPPSDEDPSDAPSDEPSDLGEEEDDPSEPEFSEPDEDGESLPGPESEEDLSMMSQEEDKSVPSTAKKLPAGIKKNQFKLPVPTPALSGKTPKSGKAAAAGIAKTPINTGNMRVNLDSLSSGLTVKQPPKLLSAAGGGPGKQKLDPKNTSSLSSNSTPFGTVPPPPPPPGREGTGAAIGKGKSARRKSEGSSPGSVDPEDENFDDDDEPSIDPSEPFDEASEEAKSGSDGGVGTTTAAATALSAQQQLQQRQLEDTKLKEAVRADALEKGYMYTLGKFEGDLYEPLFTKVDTERACLHVIIETGQQIEFLLQSKAYVFEDPKDATCFILDYHRNVVVFKFLTAEACSEVLQKLPSQVFLADDEMESFLSLSGSSSANAGAAAAGGSRTQRRDDDTLSARSRSTSKPPGGGGGGNKQGGAVITTSVREVEHIKGTSVEDLLEDGAFTGTNIMFSNEKIEELFTTTPRYMLPQQLPTSMQPPQRRKELLETYIRKPKFSVRRVQLLCEWVNAQHLWPTARVNVLNLHKEMLNGLLLARLVKQVNPGVMFVNLNERALTRKAAMQNLEQALGHIWRSKSLNNSRIPTALDIYNGNTSKISILLNEFFGVYVQRPLFKVAIKMLKWYHSVLRQYLLPLPNTMFSEGDLSGVWPHFQSGVALFCVIFHFTGPNFLGTHNHALKIKVDPLRITRNAICYGDFVGNVSYVFDLLRALEIDVLWEPKEWVTNPDTEFFLLQLSYVYEKLRTKQCVLPPAQGDVAGISSGPNGDPVVAGLIFNDSRPANSKLTVNARRAVLLGKDRHSLPLLPVDRGRGKAIGRFTVKSCPMGMMSNALEVPMVYVSLKELKDRSERHQWNNSASIEDVKETPSGTQLISLLRSNKNEQKEVLGVPGLGVVTNTREFGPAIVPSTPRTTRSSPNKQQHQQQQQQQQQQFDYANINSNIAVPLPGILAAAAAGGSNGLLKQSLAIDASSAFQGGNNNNNNNNYSSEIDPITLLTPQKKRELDMTLQSIENARFGAEGQLRSLEDDLATRYMELEDTGCGGAVDLREYEEALAALETERLELETEKHKIQEHYARKLDTAKEMFIEAEIRSRAQKIGTSSLFPPGSPMHYLHQQQQQQKGGSSFSVASGKKSVATTQKNDKERKEKEVLAKKVAEKGWISLSTKGNTHNYHMKHAVKASASALQATWTPQKIKEREEEIKKKASKTPEISDRTSRLNMRRKDLYDINTNYHGQKVEKANSRFAKKYYSGASGANSPEKQHQQDVNFASELLSGSPASDFLPENVYEAGDVSAPIDPLTAAFLSPEEIIEQSFHKFRYRLNAASMKWLQSKQQSGRERLMNMLSSSRAPSAPVVELIALPEKSFLPQNNNNKNNSYNTAGGGGLGDGEMGVFGAGISLDTLPPQGVAELREEETRRMVYEDERRRMVLSELELQQSLDYTQKLLLQRRPNHQQQPYNNNNRNLQQQHRSSRNSTNSAISGFERSGFGTKEGGARSRSVSMSPERGGERGGGGGGGGILRGLSGGGFPSPKQGELSFGSNRAPSAAEVDSALKWLHKSRMLVLADRIPREFNFSVVSLRASAMQQQHLQQQYQQQQQQYSSFGAGGASGLPNVQEDSLVTLSLEWRESGAPSMASVFVAGSILFDDIADVTTTSAADKAGVGWSGDKNNNNSGGVSLCTLVLKESTRALKNAKGRTFVSIQSPSSPVDCAKFADAIICVLRYYQ